ncbi:MAG TPA: gephyrin-like molybdotransferase Glp [Microlunatus sp.]
MPLFGRKKPEEPALTSPQRSPLPDPPEPGPSGLRPLKAHRDYLLSCVDELPPFGQHILDALGLSVCEDIVATISMPGFDNSAMDGYAVRAEDVAEASADRPVSLPVVGEVAAGQTAPHRLSPGVAMKIMTGAPLPLDADAIVPYEATDRGASDVKIFAASEVNQHIRRVGEDIEAGTQVFTDGDQLGVRDIGLLAALGHDKVLVRPRPRVVVISTGSELVDPGLPLDPEQQIYDSNSFMLAAAAKAAGAQVFRIGHVGDDPDAVKQLISDQLVRADLILTTGGVSQGDYDIIKAVMPEMGACDFSQVAMQPGKPQGFGLIGDDRTPMIMLPGNPVSAFVSFEAFVRPVIRKLMGSKPYARKATRATAAAAMTSMAGRTQLARGIVTETSSGGLQVELAGGHGSHLLGDLARSNALVILGEETAFVAAGETVDLWLLDDSHR